VRMSNLIVRYKRPVRRYLFRFSRVEDQFSSLRKVYQREWRMLRHTGGYNALPLNALCGLIFGWHVTTEVTREIAGWIDSGSRHMSQEEAIPSGYRLTLRAAHL
jgi:hypothetical protein